MITEPWWVYPPEINSARIIGPGPLPWAIASGVWSVMAAEAAAAQAVFQAQNGIQATNLVGVMNPGLISTASQFGAWLAAVNVEALDAAAANAAVVQAYFAAMGTMIPLPVVIANRVAAATAHAASAAGAVNPMGVALDMQYAGFHIQNAGVMQSYDSLVQVATTPRVFTPPPPLVTGAPKAASIDTVMRAAQAGAQQGVSTNARSVGQSAEALSAQAASARQALPPSSQQFLSQAGPVTSSMMGAPQQALAPVSSIMGQMATPLNGATGNGLGTGGGSLSSTLGSNSGLGARGGLPLGLGGGGGASMGLGGGGGAMGLAGLGGASSLLNGPLGNGLTGPARVGPMFSGIGLEERNSAARPGTPMGVPPGGMAGGQAQRKSTALMEVEKVEIAQVLTEADLERERGLFR